MPKTIYLTDQRALQRNAFAARLFEGFSARAVLAIGPYQQEALAPILHTLARLLSSRKITVGELHRDLWSVPQQSLVPPALFTLDPDLPRLEVSMESLEIQRRGLNQRLDALDGEFKLWKELSQNNPDYRTEITPSH